MRPHEVVVRQPQRHYIKSMSFELTYPCYFAFGPDGGLQLNDVDGRMDGMHCGNLFLRDVVS